MLCLFHRFLVNVRNGNLYARTIVWLNRNIWALMAVSQTCSTPWISNV